MISQDFQKQVRGYGLTTAHILYRSPAVNRGKRPRAPAQPSKMIVDIAIGKVPDREVETRKALTGKEAAEVGEKKACNFPTENKTEGDSVKSCTSEMEGKNALSC